jgi:TolB-like protein
MSILRAASEDKAGQPRFSLVVLPFANVGGVPEQKYFADGVTDSLTTDLSRRSTAFFTKKCASNLKRR